METVFTTENVESLRRTCNKIESILKDHVDGALMHSQMVCLNQFMQEYASNPIVKTSGIAVEDTALMEEPIQYQLHDLVRLPFDEEGMIIGIRGTVPWGFKYVVKITKGSAMNTAGQVADFKYEQLSPHS